MLCASSITFSTISPSSPVKPVSRLIAPIMITIMVGSHATTYIRFSRISAEKRTRSISQNSCQRLVGRSSLLKSPLPLLP